MCPSVKSGNKSQYKIDLNCLIGNETASSCLVGTLYMYLLNVKYISLTYMVGRLDKTKVDESENQNRYLKLSIVLY